MVDIYFDNTKRILGGKDNGVIVSLHCSQMLCIVS